MDVMFQNHTVKDGEEYDDIDDKQKKDVEVELTLL